MNIRLMGCNRGRLPAYKGTRSPFFHARESITTTLGLQLDQYMPMWYLNCSSWNQPEWHVKYLLAK